MCVGHVAPRVWCMNVGDIPTTRTAQDASHVRRFRCIRHRSRYIQRQHRRRCLRGTGGVLWHDQCNWAQYNTSISNDNVIESLDQLGELFLSDLSRQECSTYTPPINKSSTFQIHQRVTEKRNVFADNRHTMENSHQMFRTRDRTASRGRGRNSTLVRTSKGARRTGSDTSRTSQSTRIDQTKDSALLEVHCSECANTNLFLGEFTKRRRCDIPGLEHNAKEDDNE